MKRIFFFIGITFLLSSCNTLRRVFPEFAKEKSAPDNTLPDDYTITGTTAIDYQIIQPVRCVDSTVIVKVRWKGHTDWHLCNHYEVKIDTTGVGGGGVWFRRRVDVTYDQNGKPIYFVIYGTPVAPAGTDYSIESITNVTSHDLY